MAPALPFVVALAIAQPTQDLAPDYTQLVRDRKTLEALLADEQAVRDAVARLHNATAVAWRLRATPRCRPEIASLLARASALLRRHRQDAQTVRVRARELARLARAPTIAPLVGLDESDTLTRLFARADAAVDAHLELRAWHARYVAPVKCPFTLVPEPGVGRAGTFNAVLFLGDVVACPTRAPIREGVAVVSGEACAGDSSCTCVPRSVAPGAVVATSTAAR